MATFVSTVTFSEQGIKNIKATCERASAFKSAVEQMGVQIREIFWTLGPADGLIILDAPDEETATAAMLQLGSQGNVQTQTARAYNAAEMAEILGKL